MQPLTQIRTLSDLPAAERARVPSRFYTISTRETKRGSTEMRAHTSSKELWACGCQCRCRHEPSCPPPCGPHWPLWRLAPLSPLYTLPCLSLTSLQQTPPKPFRTYRFLAASETHWVSKQAKLREETLLHKTKLQMQPAIRRLREECLSVLFPLLRKVLQVDLPVCTFPG